jgi:hypothetical protein
VALAEHIQLYRAVTPSTILSRIVLARAYQASKDDIEQTRKDKIAEKKANTAALYIQKAIEVASRREKRAEAVLQQAAACQVAVEERVPKSIERQTRKNVLNILKVQKLAAKSLDEKPAKENLLLSKPTGSVVVPVCKVAQEERITFTMRGRLINPPKKHNE